MFRPVQHVFQSEELNNKSQVAAAIWNAVWNTAEFYKSEINELKSEDRYAPHVSLRRGGPTFSAIQKTVFTFEELLEIWNDLWF